MNRIEFTLKANQSRSEGLQFVAQSVIVDNPNSYYVYFSLIRRWVPPFTNGAVLRYGAYPSIAAFQTDLLPPGVLPLTNVQDVGVKLVFVEEEVPESGGSASSTNVQAGNFLGSWNQSGAQAQAHIVSVPSGTLTLCVTVFYTIGTTLMIQGQQSGYLYLNEAYLLARYPGTNYQYYLPLQPIDTTLVVTLNTNAGTTLIANLFAVPFAQAVVVKQERLDSLNVTTNPNTSYAQIPNLKVTRFTQALLAGTTPIIIPNVISQTIRLYGGSIESDAATPSMAIQDDAGNYLSEHTGVVGVNNPLSFNGLPLLGSAIHLYSLAAATIRGTLQYTQMQ